MTSSVRQPIGVLHLCSCAVPGVFEVLERAAIGSLADVKDGIHKYSESSAHILCVLQMVHTPGIYQDVVEVYLDPRGVVWSVEHLCLQLREVGKGEGPIEHLGQLVLVACV